MIHGIGTDILRTERIAAAFARYGERFAQRLLMPEELMQFRNSQQPVRFLAMRFAAKEAIVKALGTGFAHGIWLRDIGVAPDGRGRPLVVWSARARTLCAEWGIDAENSHLSLSDEAGLVVAMAVLLRTGT